MNPDELRKWARALRNGLDWTIIVFALPIELEFAADAWEAAAAAQQTLLAALNESTCENDTLRTRLEAAERLLRDALPSALVHANEYGEDEPEWEAAIEALEIRGEQERVAALAGEE